MLAFRPACSSCCTADCSCCPLRPGTCAVVGCCAACGVCCCARVAVAAAVVVAGAAGVVAGAVAPVETLSRMSEALATFAPGFGSCAAIVPRGSADGTLTMLTLKPARRRPAAASFQELPTRPGTGRISFLSSAAGAVGAAVVVTMTAGGAAFGWLSPWWRASTSAASPAAAAARSTIASSIPRPTRLPGSASGGGPEGGGAGGSVEVSVGQSWRDELIRPQERASGGGGYSGPQAAALVVGPEEVLAPRGRHCRRRADLEAERGGADDLSEPVDLPGPRAVDRRQPVAGRGQGRAAADGADLEPGKADRRLHAALHPPCRSVGHRRR